MPSRRAVFIILLIGAVAQILYYYSQLPDTVATHFGGSGRPNGWQSKQGFVAVYLGTTALMAAIFLSLPYIIWKVPKSMINLPNRDYWLAPERIEETKEYCGGQMLFMGSLTLLMEICAFQLVIQANLSPQVRLPSAQMWMLMGAYTAAVFIWLIKFFTGFSRPPGGAP